MNYRLQDFIKYIIPGLYVIFFVFVWSVLSSKHHLDTTKLKDFTNVIILLIPFVGFVIGYFIESMMTCAEHLFYILGGRRPSKTILDRKCKFYIIPEDDRNKIFHQHKISGGSINNNFAGQILQTAKQKIDRESVENFRMNSDRENAIRELSRIKGNCRNLVILSKTFIDTMDKSYMKFTQFHMDILNELDNENGVVRSPYFIEGCYVVYSIKNGCLTLWIFQDKIDKYLSIPTYYICVSPKDKIKGEGHQLDCMILPLLDNCMEANLRDYIDMVLDYLCLRQWAEVQLGKVSSTIKKEIKKNKKTQIITEPGLDYYIFDSKWYTEICNDECFLVSGHFRLQPYGDGTKKLIWINEYTKNGYHRKATIDKVKDGDISLT